MNFLIHDIALLKKLKKKVYLGNTLYYIIWQYTAKSKLRKLNSKIELSCAHHVSFASDSLPFAIRVLERVPKIVGPIGGSDPIPLNLYRYLRYTDIIEEFVRRAANGLLRRLAAYPFLSKCDVVIFSNSRCQERFPNKNSSFCWKSFLMPNIDFTHTNFKEVKANKEIVRIASVGKLISSKGWRLAFSVISKLGSGYQLTIYGTGKDREKLEQLARKMKISNRVIFAGHKNRTALLKELGSFDIVFLPSFRESVGWAALESLALGIPTVVLDVGGVGELSRQYGIQPVNPNESNLEQSLCKAIQDKRKPIQGIDWSLNRYVELIKSFDQLL